MWPRPTLTEWHDAGPTELSTRSRRCRDGSQPELIDSSAVSRLPLRRRVATLSPTAAPTPTVTLSPVATVASSEADQAVYASIESQVEAIRGLSHKTVVAPVLLDSAGVHDWLVKANEAQTDHVAFANESRLFIDMGLLPAGSSLEQMSLDLQAGQVVGFYDQVSKGLYVLSESGGVGPTQKITFAHEYTHALQDQTFGLDKLATDTADQGDQDLSRLALVEGDATQLMTQWATADMSILDLLAVAGDAASAEQQKQLDAAPAILRETLLFPYEDGLSFVSAVYAKGGWAAVDQLYADPPDSTSQILHPDLYVEKVKPVALSVPPVPATLGGGWKLTMQDTLGELQLGIWLAGPDATDAARIAAKANVSTWGGDRVGLYEGPAGAWAVVLRTTWRDAAGAAAFDASVGRLLSAAKTPSRSCAGTSEVTVVIASTQDVLPLLEDCSSVR